MLEQLLPVSDRANVLRVRSTQAGLLVPGRTRPWRGLMILILGAILVFALHRLGKFMPLGIGVGALFLFFGLGAMLGRRDVLFGWDGGIAVRMTLFGWEQVKIHAADTIGGVDVVNKSTRGFRGAMQAKDVFLIRRKGDFALEILDVAGLDLLSPAREALFLRLANHYALKKIPLGPGLERFVTAPTAR
jgi:hypothetical protein